MSGYMVREERAGDEAAIRSVNESAFGGSEEAELVERLRADGVVLVSLVAEVGGHITGHLLLSRMWIDAAEGEVPAVALAPLAVLPEYQRSGIGTRLTEHGLQVLRNRGEGIVLVVGHPGYYARFGFACDAAHGLTSPFPREFFMALELRRGALEGLRGPVRYARAFGG